LDDLRRYHRDFEMTTIQIGALLDAGKIWHREFAKAFITTVSTGDGEYFIKVKFKTMAEMHAAYDAMANLAAMTKDQS